MNSKEINLKALLTIVASLLVLYGIAQIMEPYEDVKEVPKQEKNVEQPMVEAFAPVALPSNVEEQQIVDSEKINPSDLLPKYDDANEFALQNPVSKLLKEQNFLISGYHVGINTVMQSNKIPYYDIRSAPPIPKEEVGPWSQSSYETPAGSGRRGLEIL